MRLVLLQFDDNAAAEAYVASLANGGKVFASVPISDEGEYRVVEADMSLRGFFAQPTRMCECGPSKFLLAGRSDKFGWYVCRNCKRAKPHTTHLLKNLLKPGIVRVEDINDFLSVRVGA